ncbi:hypothetical protein B0H63DRAFT_183116 [Podospora didyma]|uniref:Uncharacterized protein n=1 Tax=Podospora didyma TaxID=330526 RepID=A0AAE0TZQ0_9PEZI|nr:hypothetical protein B0H63DRAFT_183116 [Podospora didyma]
MSDPSAELEHTTICVRRIPFCGDENIFHGAALDFGLDQAAPHANSSHHAASGIHSILAELIPLFHRGSSGDLNRFASFAEGRNVFIKLEWTFPDRKYPRFATRHLLTPEHSASIRFIGDLDFAIAIPNHARRLSGVGGQTLPRVQRPLPTKYHHHHRVHPLESVPEPCLLSRRVFGNTASTETLTHKDGHGMQKMIWIGERGADLGRHWPPQPRLTSFLTDHPNRQGGRSLRQTRGRYALIASGLAFATPAAAFGIANFQHGLRIGSGVVATGTAVAAVPLRVVSNIQTSAQIA